MSCNSPCTVLFTTAFKVCCETLTVQCKKLSAQATKIECMINAAKDRGELFVYVNKSDLPQELVTALEDACYKAEFIPNPSVCGCTPDTNPNGFYKISWCICTCECSSSSCCDDLPGHCWPTSLTCEDFPADSGTAQPCGCSETSVPTTDCVCN